MTTPSFTVDALTAALPETTGTLSLPGLDGPIAIYRDRWGIPHVRAGSVHDAFFGQGFVHAQDRLWQMDADRRRASGRWAAVVGPAGLEQDVLMRRFRLVASARADYEQGIDAETRATLDAYADGVNAFVELARASGRLPVEYRLLDEVPAAWRPWDSLLVYKVRHVQMGVWEAKVWRARLVNQVGPAMAARLLPGYAPGHLLVVPPGAAYSGPPLDGLEILEQGAAVVGLVPAVGGRRSAVGSRESEDRPPTADRRLSTADSGPSAAGCRPPTADSGGSNNWAVAGSRTAAGGPIVAGDPHRALDVPNVYYQNHLACPDFDAVGFSFAGVPGFPHFGHNASVAWCITHAGADYQDLFVERFDTEDPTRYWFVDGWRAAERHHEVIEVRGAAAVELGVTVTHHGPIVLGDPADGHAIAFRYTATAEPVAAFNALLPMLRATTAREFEEAMRPWVDPANNLIFADTGGTVAYRTRGRVPIRSAANAWLPVPGWTGEHEWQGMIPFEEMPAIHNAAAGFVATANNRIVGGEYPHHLALDFAPGFRAQRIVDRLQSGSGLQVADMAALHADRLSIPAGVFARLVAAVEPVDEGTAWARDLLLAWDGVMDGASSAAAVYAAFREHLLHGVLAPIFGPLAGEALAGSGRGGPAHVARIRARLHDLIARGDRSLLSTDASWTDLMQTALARAVQTLRDTLGEDRTAWRWDRLHRTRPVHPLAPVFPDLAGRLNPPSAAIGGDGDTVAAASFAPGGDFTVTGTSVARYAFDLADWSRSGWAVPLGASGHPASPHYADQVAAWSECRLLPMLYDWDHIRSTAESHQSLVPGS